MKQILVPTDFSVNAAPAMEYAINLANFFLCDITLFNAFSPAIYSHIDDYMQQTSEQQMEQWVERYRHRLRDGASLNSLTVRAEPAAAIAHQADHYHYDLIIMGTQGESGIKGFLMGSTTLEVLHHAKTAILAIPQHAHPQPPHHIVLAIDERGIPSPQILNPLRELTKPRQADVCVFRQVREETTPVPDLLVDAALQGIRHSFHQEQSEEEIWNGILDFATQQQADLICLLHRERNFIERFFHHSISREELSSSSVPLLFIHDERSPS